MSFFVSTELVGVADYGAYMSHTHPTVIALRPMMDFDAGLCILRSVDVWLDTPSDKAVIMVLIMIMYTRQTLHYWSLLI